MRRPVIALSLLAAAPLVAAIGGTGYPSDELIVRDCYGGFDEDLNGQLQQQFGGASGGTAATPRPVPRPAPAPAPKPPPTVELDGTNIAVAKGKGGGKKAKNKPSGGGGLGLAKKPASSNMAEAPPPEPEPEEAMSVDDLGGDAGLVSDTSTSGVLTEEYLQQLPTGRSYQSAVGEAAGVTGSGGSDGAEQTRRRAEESARKQAESEARRRAEENARFKSESEARRRAEEEAMRKADAERSDAEESVKQGRYQAEQAAKRAAEAAAAAREAKLAAERAAELAKDAERAREAAEKEAQRSIARRALDWGATIFLSNDDSMSLASAQRVIYAVQRGMRVPTREIRPHELLNYFSFDVAEPSAEQLFDVHASAVQEGEQLAVALAVKGATPTPQPLDLTLVVDRSCSMEDEGRMDFTKRGLQKMTSQLSRGDRVDLVLFDDTICTPVENFVVGRDDLSVLETAIARMQPDGGTNLDIGLKEGYRIATGHVDTHGRNRRVMVLTDADLNQGDVNPHTVTEIAKNFEERRIRLTGVGVGRSFRDDVLDTLTEKGKGAYVFLGSEGVVDRVFGSGFPSLVQTIAHDVRFQLDLPDNVAMERFYGEEASTVAADIQPIHYYAGTSQVFLQDLAVKPGKLDASQPVTLTVSYREADTGEPAKRVFRTTLGQMLRSDSHNVTKAKALMAWTDMLQSASMGADPCGEALGSYTGFARQLSDDAEIAFVNDLVIRQCGSLPLATAVVAAPLKVHVDSDQPISTVGLACPGISPARETLSGSDTVARFDATPGTCTVTLAGVVDLNVEVEVPETGRDLRCTVRGGRVHCG